jgi:sulfite reductase (NADPH) hemoprotein beta-component
MSEEKKLAVNEGLKTESRYLRGTLAEGLADLSTGGISEGDQQLIKFHGSYQQDDRDLRANRRKHKLEKAYSFMIRIRVPGGVSTAQQWLEMDRMADDFGNGTLKLTTRQAYQLHGVIKSNLKRTIKEINDTAMDTIAACGDVNRNVMCNPNPEESEVHAAVQDVAQALSDHLTPATGAYHEIWLDGEKVESSEDEEEPIYGKTYLPRKFKIAVAVPPSNDVDIYAHDLSFIAIEGKKGLEGFNVSVGGGMGMTHGQEETYPRTADVIGFVPVAQVLEVAEKVVLVQRDFGDRTNRKHARLKYTIDDRGIDWFVGELESRLDFKLQAVRDFKFEHNGDRFGWVENADGTANYTLFIQGGRIIDTEARLLRTGLRELAQLVKAEFRLTANQNLTLAKVTAEERPKVDALLKNYGLQGSEILSGLRLNSIACVSLPTCGLALAEAERYLPDLIEELEEVLDSAGLRQDAITIRMTGCPNGCARPFISEIGFVGRGPDRYNVYLGGGHAGQRLSKLWHPNVSSSDIKSLLTPVIEAYAKERQEGEHFGDYVIRAGVVAETKSGKEFHQNVGPREAAGV